MPGRLSLPGFVNAHSHAFQRAMRGRAEGDDFWGWRDAMLAEAEALTSERVREVYEATYREMLTAGYTAVGEFHYIGFGWFDVSGRRRVPSPPAITTAFIGSFSTRSRRRGFPQ